MISKLHKVAYIKLSANVMSTEFAEGDPNKGINQFFIKEMIPNQLHTNKVRTSRPEFIAKSCVKI